MSMPTPAGMAQMVHTDEPKMDDLKRLLRRLDGLDGSKSLAKTTQEVEAEHRGYVGALRGAPAIAGEEPPPSIVPPAPKATSNSGVYIAAATAALISTVTVYLMMSWQQPQTSRGEGPASSSSQPIVPSKLDFRSPQPGSTPRQSTDADGLVRRAEQLLQGGDIDTARVLLQQAAELGSGYAALKLGRSYDPAQIKSQTGTQTGAPTGALRYADSQTNPALAKAWYERALALGTQEAAAYISDAGGR